MWIRHVLVPGVTDDEEGLKELNKFIKTLKTVDRVEVLPYHTLGLFKWENLKIPYPLKNVPTPSDEAVKRAEELLEIQNNKAYKFFKPLNPKREIMLLHNLPFAIYFLLGYLSFN